ncbi:MAG TPA: creatininase family protein [Gemmatimonadaceae bacterium]|nr:creatininase family protein [Gemmatimonadaceae bacterium]
MLKLLCVVVPLLLVLPESAALAQRPGAYLAELTWPDAERRFREAPVVIVPFGAGAKEHGPHLPLSTDQIVLEHLLETAVDSLPVLVAPPILHGWFPAFREFPGTGIDDPDVFREYVLEVARSLVRHGARRVVFLNTGITRSTGLPLGIVARQLHTTTRAPTLLVSWDDLETAETDRLAQQRAGGHADEIETSIVLALRPELVRMDRAVTDYGSATGTVAPGYRPSNFSRNRNDPEFSETGVFGDPRLATVEKGRRALAIMRTEWLKALRNFATVALPAR